MNKSNWPKSAQIVEVGPRDGLQNESLILSLEVKLQYIERLIQSGLQRIESTSFVSPKSIPQMSDALELQEALHQKYPKELFLALVPNLKGWQSAKKAQMAEIAFFTATSETFNQKNIRASIAQSFERFEPIAKEAQSDQVKIRGYVSTVFGCPYEGKTSVETLIQVCERLFALGCYEISLGDTIGIATPCQVTEVLSVLKSRFDLKKFAMHFHDTRGLALANVQASLDFGIDVYDASSGGLGGCPYAKGASGNLATEDLYGLLESQGISTGVDIAKLVQASEFILGKLNKTSLSKYYQYYQRSHS